MAYHKNAPHKHLPYYAGGCLYAVELTSGAIKVGRTKQPRLRMDTLLYYVRTRWGLAFSNVHMGPDIGKRIYPLEHALIARMEEVGGSRIGRAQEFFENVPFAKAVELVTEISTSPA